MTRGVYETLGGRWRAKYRTAAGRQRSRTFDDKSTAVAWRASQTAAVRAAGADAPDPSLSRITVGTVGAQWLAGKAGLEETSTADYESLWRVHVEPYWGGVRLGRVTPGEVSGWLHGLGLSHSRRRRVLLVLRQVFDLAVASGYLPRHPLPKGTVSAGRTGRPQVEPLSHIEVDRLASEAGAESGLVLFCCYTGLRMSEVCALTVTDVDWRAGLVSVSKASVELATPGERRQVDKGTKTGRVRVIPAPLFVVEGLTRPRSGRLFREPDGGPLVVSKFRGRMLRAGRRAGLEGRVTPKRFRDTAASLAIQSGASVKMVQGLLGHASAQVTLDRYAALFPEDLTDLARRLSVARTAALTSER